MHWQNTGRDKLTSAAVRYQLWFGRDGFNLAFSRYLVLYIFNLAFVPGKTSNEFPVLRQCKTLAAT